MTTRAERAGRDAAETVRRSLGLDDAPIADMVDLVESRGACDVAVESMPPGMDGMVATDPESQRRVIAVATTDLLHRQRFTLAHELGHLEFDTLGDHPAVGQRSGAEVQADAFARHLLAPLGGVRRSFEASKHNPARTCDEDLSDVVRSFRVSPQVAAIQMREVGWIDAGEYEALKAWDARSLATRFGWRSEYEAWAAEARQSRPPRRLLQRTLDGYVAGLVSITAVANVSGVRVEEAQAQLDTEGVRPVEPEIEWFDPDA